MHLRHIDPGSSEWMDAMIEEGEQPVRGGTHGGRKSDSTPTSMEALGSPGRDTDGARGGPATDLHSP